MLMGAVFPVDSSSEGEPSPPAVEILKHEWRPDTVWEKIGKTKFIWNATVRNRSDIRKRVFVYYDLLDDQDHPLASNVANKTIEPQQTVNVVSDSYINTDLLPKVRSSRVRVKVGFPN
jgi:hypothetical protein